MPTSKKSDDPATTEDTTTAPPATPSKGTGGAGGDGGDGGNGESQPDMGDTTATLEEAHEKGFLGTHPDPEPNESYTVEGVTKDK